MGKARKKEGLKDLIREFGGSLCEVRPRTNGGSLCEVRPRTNKHLETGRRGEAEAKKYLEEKGYEILAQDFKTKHGEIDLVAKKRDELVLVEVRTRTGEKFGAPAETIGPKKKQKLRLNALACGRRLGWKGSLRVDALCVVLNQKGSLEILDHYQNIVDG
jgi:putative endonuclease